MIQGTKYELRKEEVSLATLLGSIKDKMFEQKEPFLIHLLRKELGRQVRKDLRQNLREDDLNNMSDFSKGFVLFYFLLNFINVFWLRACLTQT